MKLVAGQRFRVSKREERGVLPPCFVLEKAGEPGEWPGIGSVLAPAAAATPAPPVSEKVAALDFVTQAADEARRAGATEKEVLEATREAEK